MTSSPPPSRRPPRRDDPRMRTAPMAALRDEDVADGDTLVSGPITQNLPDWRAALLVAAGGALGAALRFVFALAIPTVTTPTLIELPWSTFVVNGVGCLGLGILNGVLEVRAGRPWLRPLLGTGLCGGFTTMSTVVFEGSAMIGAGFVTLALNYALVTLVLAVIAILLGLAIGRRIGRAADRRHASRTGRAERGDRASEEEGGA